MVCIIAQGSKQVVVGNATLDYDAGKYLISSVDLPVSGRVTSATPTQPYLALGLELDPRLLATILLDLPKNRETASLSRGVAVSPNSPELLEAFVRLLRLLDSPGDIGPLGPLTLREIFYRLLTGEQARMLRQIALQESRLPQIMRVIEWIRQNYARPLHITKPCAHGKYEPRFTSPSVQGCHSYEPAPIPEAGPPARSTAHHGVQERRCRNGRVCGRLRFAVPV